MRYEELKPAEKADIDLHGHTVDEAEILLIEKLESLPKTVKMLAVTHGYSRGTSLKRMVKNDFYHWRILSKQVGLNAGTTYFVLK